MNPEIKKFIESFREKPVKQFSINDFRTKAGNISFNKLLKEHNHEIWRTYECGNQEDLRKSWTCSNCGKTLFEPK